MDMIKCPSCEGCAAPLCPLEPLQNAQWFPDEAICNSRAITKPFWVKTQLKIQRLYLKGWLETDCCFTLAILEGIKTVRHPKGMRPEDLHRKEVGKTRQKASISLAPPLKQP